MSKRRRFNEQVHKLQCWVAGTPLPEDHAVRHIAAHVWALAADAAAEAQRLGLVEIVINTWTHDPTVRRRSCELLAAEFGLSSRAD